MINGLTLWGKPRHNHGVCDADYWRHAVNASSTKDCRQFPQTQLTSKSRCDDTARFADVRLLTMSDCLTTTICVVDSSQFDQCIFDALTNILFRNLFFQNRSGYNFIVANSNYATCRPI